MLRYRRSPSSFFALRLLIPVGLLLLLVACAPIAGSDAAVASSVGVPRPPSKGLPVPPAGEAAPSTESTPVEMDEATPGVEPEAEADASAEAPVAAASLPAAEAGPVTLGTAPAEGAAYYLAPVVPFDTVQDDITLADVQARWQDGAALYTTSAVRELLVSLLGEAGDNVITIERADLIGALEQDREALGILPFEELDPRFKVLTLDGINLLSNQFAPGTWPLVAATGSTNRDSARLSTLVMTGVTAMARGTAAAIERNSVTYPAEVIGPELALADITHVSNEIPFIEGCVVNNTENNLTLCSDPTYWAALELMGTDIVGLSGNHVNDFGRDGARESLGWYKENDIPIYGSGLTVDEACAPLYWEHNGNTFAFVAALAYGPDSAWVTDEEPGACYYYEHKERILSLISTLSRAVDIVAVELQYEETYFASPTAAQVEEFRELRATGADLVTGVQSHVPQAQEPYGAYDAGGRGMISYGLGNLFFDQMWSWETRTELYARHTIYAGQIVSTEILTGLLEDFAQPRWTTPEERADLLETIFYGAPARE